MRTRTISLMCMLVLGTGITAQASTLKAEALSYPSASVPTPAVNDEQLEQEKQLLYKQLDNLQAIIPMIERSLTEAGIIKSHEIWSALNEVKAQLDDCRAMLDAADSTEELYSVRYMIESLSAQIQRIQMDVDYLRHEWPNQAISFADANVKSICVSLWDGILNGERDGELSHAEAAAVQTIYGSETSINYFQGTSITSFNEFQYFTGLTSIPDEAFEGCTSLTAITLPEKVTTIGAKAFAGCSQLHTLRMSSKVTSIASSSDAGAFYGIDIATINVTIDCSSDHPTIVDNLFYNQSDYCPAIMSVTLGKGITSIGVQAFEGCTGMTSITIPSTVTTIGRSAFQQCRTLTSIDIPRGVTDISEAMLFGCNSLSEVIIPEGVTNIWGQAFGNCSSLSKITIPSTVESIGQSQWGESSAGYTFNGCTSLTTIQVNAATPPVLLKTNVFDQSTYTNATLLVPATCETAYAAAEGWSSFTHRTPNYEYVDSQGVVYRFLDTDDGKATVVRYEGTSATVNIPESITAAGTTYPVTTIGEGAFANSSMRTLNLTTSVWSIHSRAFFDVEHQDDIPIITVNVSPTSTNTILGGISEFDTMKTPFSTVYGVETVNICEGITEIAKSALIGGLFKMATVSSTVTKIGESAFLGCANLQIVTLNEGLQSIGWCAFQGCGKLYDITIPSSVTYIENGAFQDCTSLVQANIPDGVEFIGAQLFENTQLSKITIPASVTKIWDKAFAGCSLLREVTLEQDDPTKIVIDGDPFPTPHSDIRLYIPFWAEAAYRADDSYWKDFNIQINGCFEIDNMLYWVCPNTVVPFAVLQHPVDNSLVKGEVTIPAQIDIHGYTFQVTTFAAEAFKNCYNLLKLNIPYTVTEIGVNAFERCWQLNSIDMKATMEVVDPTAFQGMNYTVVTIAPYGDQTTIKPNLFKGCFHEGGYSSVVLGEGITGIGEGAFADCQGLWGLSITTDLTTIGSGALHRSTESDPQMSIYLTVNPGASSTAVADNLFNVEGGFMSLTSVTLNEGVTSVGKSAFYCCLIREVYLPETLEAIGDFAFTSNTSLTDLYVKWPTPLDITGDQYNPIQNGNVTIKLHVPLGTSALYKAHPYWGTYFDIPEDNDVINGFVYQAIPNTDHELKVIKYVGENTKLSIPESVYKDNVTYQVTGIAGNIFTDMGDVVLTIPESVTSINDQAFKGCASIIVIAKWAEPLSLEQPPVFSESDVRTLLVPLGTKDEYYGENWDTFGYSNIEEYLPFADSEVEERCLKYWDENNIGVLLVSRAQEITSFGNEAESDSPFFVQTGIKTFDELKYFTGLTRIGNQAFYGCWNLERITIPGSVQSLGYSVFGDCRALKSVTVEWTTPIDVDDSIDPFPSKEGITLYVPAGTKSNYQNHTYWKNFFIAEALSGDASGDGGVDIDDALAIVNYILGQPSDGFVEANADVNGDGKITIADAVSLVNMILN
ncbi:MAG: leucine-rich repeat protein [Prevotella sp.]|nr:leucine-rich repeat protein [Prevotella sp.]